MKRHKRRLHIPQHEFGFVPQAFNLVAEQTQDGDHIIHKRAVAEAGQVALFTVKPKPVCRVVRRRTPNE